MKTRIAGSVIALTSLLGITAATVVSTAAPAVAASASAARPDFIYHG